MPSKLSRIWNRRAAVKARLAEIPGQNPNIIIEADMSGRVTYLNPVAQMKFPELWKAGFQHPLLADMPKMMEAMADPNMDFVAREIELDGTTYEEKVCCILNDTYILVFAHDITARKRAEQDAADFAQQSRAMAHRVVVAQERERKRIAQELHDEAGQALVALKISLELLQEQLPENAELETNFQEAIALTDSTRNQIRLLALGLRPPVLDTLGLNLALDEFCKDFARRTHLEIQYDGTEVPIHNEAARITLFRCLQEALANVAQHSGADQAKVRLSQQHSKIRLEIEDQGQGIEAADIEAIRHLTSGLGLLGMRERVEMLGGSFEVETRPGAGTRIVAELEREASR